MEKVSKEGKPLVDVILVTKNLLEYTKLAIKTLYKNTKVPFHLIVVDVVSNDGTQDWLKNLAKEKGNVTLKLLKKADKGFAYSFNTGLKLCKTPYAASYHSDMLVSQTGWLRHLLFLMKDPKIAYVGSKLLYPNGKIQHAGCSWDTKRLLWFHIGRFQDGNKFNKTREVPGSTGAGALHRIAAIPNGLSTIYARGMHSDVELSAQLRSEGWKIYYCSKSILYHEESRSKKPDQLDPRILAESHLYNKKLFAERWNSWLIKDMREKPRLYDVSEERI